MSTGRALRSASHNFACHTAAAPGHVWSALTDAGRTRTYLHGLALHSDWTAGAHLTADRDGTVCLTGEVICSRPGERLSYLVRSGPYDPATYVTWVVRPNPTGTTIGLQIDEPDTPGGREDTEDTWLPVLDALQCQLRGQADHRAH